MFHPFPRQKGRAMWLAPFCLLFTFLLSPVESVKKDLKMAAAAPEAITSTDVMSWAIKYR